jgi:hypothetical protein
MSAVSKLYSDAKTRATKKGLEFNIELEDIVIPDMCPILDIKLEKNKIHKGDNSPSLDRIDNAKGYIKGNVWVISSLANQMKSSANKEQLIKFGQWTLTLSP